MNNFINEFLLTGNKFIPEIHLSLYLTIVLVNHLLNIEKKHKNLTLIRLGFLRVVFSGERGSF